MKNDRPGRSLESLVAFLEGALATDDGIRIESPAKLRDRVTGKLREHDVLITRPTSHLKVSIAIECRDRKRPVTVAQVEEFSRKCEDTGVSKGILVSPKGFWETAKKKASFYQISCVKLDDIESHDWLALPYILLLRSRLIHTELTVAVKEEGCTQQAMGRFFTPEGEEVSQQSIKEAIWRATMPIVRQIMAPGKAVIPFRIPVGDLRAEDLDSGGLLTVIGLKGTVQYEIQEEKGAPFKTMKYQDVESSDSLADLAIVRLDTNAGKKDLVFARRSSDGMVSLQTTAEEITEDLK